MKISEQTWEATTEMDINGYPLHDVVKMPGGKSIADCLASRELAEQVAHLPDCVRLLKEARLQFYYNGNETFKVCEEIEALLREIGEV